MTTITTRSGKGSPLTNAEMDANLTNLNTYKTENSAAAITGGTIDGVSIGATTPVSSITTSGNISVGADLIVTGNLTINGTTTTLNSTTITVDDKNIELGSVASPDNTTADGGGITLKGATDKTFNWVNSTSAWTSSEHLSLASGKEYKINGTSVLTASTLGSGVTTSSLTSLGTLTALNVSGNITISGTGKRIVGDFTSATITDRTSFQTSTANSTTGIYALPSGTATAASWQATNAADPTNASKILIATNGSTDVQLVSGRNGTGAYLPLSVYTGGSKYLELSTNGILALGGQTIPSTNTPTAFYVDGDISMSGSSRGILGNLYYESVTSPGWKYVDNGYAWGIWDNAGSLIFGTTGAANASGAGAVASVVQRISINTSGTVTFGTNAGTNTHTFGYNEGGGEYNILTSAGTNGLLLDTITVGTNISRALHAQATGDLQLGLASANTTGSVVFMRAGYLEAARIASTGYMTGTPNGAASGLIAATSRYIQNADRTGTNATTAQGILGNTTGLAVNVISGTKYEFELVLLVAKTSASATSLQLAWQGTAVLAAIEFEALSKTAAASTTLATTNQYQNRITTGFSTLTTVSVASAAAAASMELIVRGVIDVTTAGTLRPVFAFTVAPTVGTIKAGTRMSITPLAATGADVNIGSWA